MTNSTSDFNAPEFKEYNPTPYCGGYDQSLHYGKPLPPSNSICYPPSISLSNSSSLNGFSSGSIPSLNGTDQTNQSQNGSSPIKPNKEEEKNNMGFDGYGNCVYGSNSWGEDIFSNGYAYGYGSVDCGNGYASDYGYGREEEIANYGRHDETHEELGPCADIFGYWPCLYKRDRKGDNRLNNYEQESHGNPLKGTAEYLFGRSLYPYGERKDEDISYGYASYGYERHYQEQSQLVQVKNNEESWFQMPGYNEAYQEESSPTSKYLSSASDLVIHHGYERHYQEQTQFRQIEYKDQSSSQSPGYYEAYAEEGYPMSNYLNTESDLVTRHGYERHYQEPLHIVQATSNGQSLFQNSGNYEGYQEHTQFRQIEYNEQTSSKSPGYYEAYPGERYPASNYLNTKSDLVVRDGYERHYQRPSHIVQAESNGQSSFQNSGYYEAYPEEGYPA